MGSKTQAVHSGERENQLPKEISFLSFSNTGKGGGGKGRGNIYTHNSDDTQGFCQQRLAFWLFFFFFLYRESEREGV